MSSTLMFVFPALVLAGLIFVIFVGRRRFTSRGRVDTPAPGSPDSPLFAKPKEPPKNRKGGAAPATNNR